MKIWILVAVWTLPHGVVAGNQISEYIAVFGSAEACLKNQALMDQNANGGPVWKCEPDIVK